MKQGKLLGLLGLMLSYCSCSEMEEFCLDSSISAGTVYTRTAGDGLYDVLGYGYDITEEYMGENSTKLKVLDVESFVKDYGGRFDNPFIGTIDQRVYAGEDVNSFLDQVSLESNFSTSIANINKDQKVDSKSFTGTIKSGFKSTTLHSYSSKFSFARAEILKKQRKYLLNTDIETLSRYLSSVFLEDINRYSADKIVEIYGTHVLTNIIVGGKYTAYYKSVILDETNRTEKTKTVSAGAKSNLSKIGLDANGSWSKTEITEMNKKNSSWECIIKSNGGSTSGTSMTITPNQGPSYTINLGAWTESVDDKHSRLVDVDWNYTYPIYDLISDPIKKAQLKDAVIRYIASKQVKMLKVVPLYQYGKNIYFHYNTQPYSLGWERHGIMCYVLSQQNGEKALPLYQYAERDGARFHYSTQTYSLGWTNQGVTCYVYPEKVYDELIPLYQYRNVDIFHYSTQAYSLGWENDGIVGYVF